MPEELFRQEVAYFLTKLDEHLEVVKRANRGSSLICSPKVENEASCRLQGALRLFAELKKPIDVIFLLLVPVSLFAQERERRACHDKIHGISSEVGESFAAVSAELPPERGSIDLKRR